MNAKFVVEYLKRCNAELGKLSVNPWQRLCLWIDFAGCTLKHGCIINHYCRGGLYAVKGIERKNMLTYSRFLKLMNACNDREAIGMLNSKHVFNAHFSEFVKRSWLYSKEMTFEQFSRLYKGDFDLILKPEDGVEGNGVRKLTLTERKGHFDDEAYLKQEFEKCKDENIMIEECLVQHPNMVFGNASVNTIRVHSIMDKEGNVKIFKPLLRAGVGNSVVDNYCHGGCVYELHPETGHIISPSLKKDGSAVYVHPQTEIFMIGRQIPNWEMVRECVKKAHKTATPPIIS